MTLEVGRVAPLFERDAGHTPAPVATCPAAQAQRVEATRGTPSRSCSPPGTSFLAFTSVAETPADKARPHHPPPPPLHPHPPHTRTDAQNPLLRAFSLLHPYAAMLFSIERRSETILSAFLFAVFCTQMLGYLYFKLSCIYKYI